MTAFTESSFHILANVNVPESGNYAFDGAGKDHDSVGLFQQRPSQGWGGVGGLMTVDARIFLEAMWKVSSWETRAPGDVAQAVQRSEAPGAYGKALGMATDLCAQYEKRHSFEL